jgi:hypothetical protein
MFADNVRISGLKILAKHKIREGLPMCIDLIEPQRWGARRRIKGCLNVLRVYGGAAKSEIPRLIKLEEQLVADGWKEKELKQLKLAETIKEIESDSNPPTLQSIDGSFERTGS